MRSTRSRRKRLTLIIDTKNPNYAFQGTSRFGESPIIHVHHKPLILDAEISDFTKKKILFISTPPCKWLVSPSRKSVDKTPASHCAEHLAGLARPLLLTGEMGTCSGRPSLCSLTVTTWSQLSFPAVCGSCHSCCHCGCQTAQYFLLLLGP